MKRLRRLIARIRKQHPDHWAGRVWHWANKHGVRTRLRRFRAYRDWARHRYLLAKSKGAPHGVRHRYWVSWHMAKKRAKFLKAHLPKHPDPPPSQGNFVTYDGHLVPRWIYEQALAPARASGQWNGSVISGYRTPAYSEQLCYAMCGHPTCPGQCAGQYSNHACPPSHTGVPYEGAVDVSDPWGLQAWCSSHGYPIRHVLVNDANHFSRTGQ